MGIPRPEGNVRNPGMIGLNIFFLSMNKHINSVPSLGYSQTCRADFDIPYPIEHMGRGR